MSMELPDEELSQAAARLRNMRFPAAYTATTSMATLIALRIPMAEWLELSARQGHDHDRISCFACAALPTARKILSMTSGSAHE